MTIQTVTFSLPASFDVAISTGKPAKGEPTTYFTGAVDISAWSGETLLSMLQAGLRNIGGDRLANTAKECDLLGEANMPALVKEKQARAKAWLATLSAPDATPGRKPSEASPKASPIKSLAACVAMVRQSVSPDDLGMTPEEYEIWVPRNAEKIRAKAILAAGRNPETYDAEEEAKAKANADAATLPEGDNA